MGFGQPGKRRPSRIKHFFGFSVRKIGQSLTRFGIKTWAIRTADRLERQCKHYRVPDQRFKIDMLVDDRVVKSFVLRVREKLLNFDLDRQDDIVEAPHTLADSLSLDVSRDQNAVVERFEPDIHVHCGAVFHTDDSIAEAFGDDGVNLVFTHLAGAVHEVEHRNGERGGSEIRHEQRFYALVVLLRCL